MKNSNNYRKYLMILKGAITLLIVILFFTDFMDFDYRLIGLICIFLFMIDASTTDKQVSYLDQKVKSLQAVDKISRIIDEFPETHTVLENITEVVAETMGYSASVIMYYNEGKDELVTEAGYGINDDVLIQLAREHGKGLERRIIDEVEPVVKFDCEDGCPNDIVALCEHNICFGVSVPLLYKKRIIGTLSIYNDEKKTFTEADKELLQLMSSRIGIVLENDRLYKEVRSSSITDGLTGLFNHRQFYERLRFEIDNAKEEDISVFILMIDIDGFKGFNDRYGHVVGDRVLVEVSKIIKNSIRETDVAARYGGEEFGVILPNITYETAVSVADRIRNGVKRITPKIDAVHELITVSIGIACYPHCTNDLKTLVDIADVRMYKGKELGGDRVVA